VGHQLVLPTPAIHGLLDVGLSPLQSAVKNSIRELRGERGWSQAVLAAELGVSRQTVNAIETGRYDPSLPLAFAMARLFKHPLDAIFFPSVRERKHGSA
jgi:putative transcriptional regulator